MEALDEAVMAMMEEAKARGVLGTALVALYAYGKDGSLIFRMGGASTKLFREPDPSRGPDDKGTNYGGFAAGKLFQSLRTEENLSNRSDNRRGESPARGAVIGAVTGDQIDTVVAFSGGTEDEDVVIANVGLAHLMVIHDEGFVGGF